MRLPTIERPAGPIRVAQLNAPADILYFPGPVSLQYEVMVTNPTDETITLRRLDLRTGAYRLRTTSAPMNVKIAPKSTASFTVSAWGRARGGYIAANEPVFLTGTAYSTARPASS